MNGHEGTRVLITNDAANHSPADWAAATADRLVQVGPHASATIRSAGMRLEARIIDILAPHHQTVQNAERELLTNKGDPHFDADHFEAHQDTAEAAVADIVAAAKGTPFETVFASEAGQQAIRETIASHFATSANIERQWHARRNPTDRAKAFLDIQHPGQSAAA